jgi:hypothetical protein
MGHKLTKPYVSKAKLEKVFAAFEQIQKKYPSEYVTKSQVKEITQLNYRLITRTFQILYSQGRIDRYGKGEWWLPSYLAKERKFLDTQEQYKETVIRLQKEEIEKLTKTKEGILRIAKPYLDALLYLKSDEDWELLENFFHKMHANKMEQIEKEYFKGLEEQGIFPDIENARANEK